MASRFELFTRFSIFKGLSVDDLFSLLTKVSLDFENYQMGDSILEKGANTKGLVFLLDGTVEVKKDPASSEKIKGPALLVYTQIFGDHPQAPVQIEAASECGMMYIDPQSILHLLRSSEVVLKNYLDLIFNTLH